MTVIPSEFPSRFFLAPINTGYAVDGVPTERLLDFHRERSGHRIGVAYVGNVAIDEQNKSNDGTAIITQSDMTVWRRLSQAIEECGSIPAIQLACKLAGTESRRGWKCPDRRTLVETMQKRVSELPTGQIESMCAGFVDSAGLAVKAGFRIVQIHAAHGYLLALLMNRVLNQRDDQFRDGRRALAQIADGIRANTPQTVLDVRISLFDGLESLPDERAYRAAQIGDLPRMGYDLVSVSAGMYDLDRRMIYPGKREGARVYLDDARAFASRFPDTVWNVAGNLGGIAELQDQSPPNLTFGLGRPLIADPEFVEKSLSGRESEIVRCEFKGHCHYFSRGKSHIECGVNPSV